MMVLNYQSAEFENFNYLNVAFISYKLIKVGLNALISCREASRPMSKKNRHLVLAVASGCRHVIRPFCNHFSH